MIAFCQLCFKEIMMMMVVMSYHYCQILHYQFATGVLRSTNRSTGDTSPSPAGHAQHIERPDTDFKGDV